VDLLPARSAEFVLAEVTRGRGTRSLSTHLKSRLGLDGVKMGLLHERLTREQMLDAPTLARTIKALPIELVAPRPIDEAISSAGGVCFNVVDEHLMLRQMPGVFCAGEMLDWEAPTGGYLLTACFATGRRAGEGAVRWLRGLPLAQDAASPDQGSAPGSPLPMTLS
jgi:predicted flavoprotein YhiN